jgi:hypothetical protein
VIKMGNSLGADLFGIASALIGVALVALLVGNASKTTSIIQSGTSGFNTLLQTVTLQNGGLGSLSSPVAM